MSGQGNLITAAKSLGFTFNTTSILGKTTITFPVVIERLETSFSVLINTSQNWVVDLREEAPPLKNI